MIESTALALSFWYLYFIPNYLSGDESARNKRLLLVAIMATGMLAALTKVTTFCMYYLIGGLYLLSSSVWQIMERLDIPSLVKKNFPFLVTAIMLPLAAAFVWTRYSDSVKSFNPLGAHLTSTNLANWNFGTWEQKLNWNTWSDYFSRSLTDLFGELSLFLHCGPAASLLPQRTVGIVLLLVLLYLLPVMSLPICIMSIITTAMRMVSF